MFQQPYVHLTALCFCLINLCLHVHCRQYKYIRVFFLYVSSSSLALWVSAEFTLSWVRGYPEESPVYFITEP